TDHATHQLVTDRHLGDAPSGANSVALLEVFVRAEDHRADTVLAEVEGECEHRTRAAGAGHLEQLAGHRVFQPINTGYAVADRGDHTLVGVHHRRLEACYALFEDLSDLVAAYGHLGVSPLSRQAST